MSHLFMTTDWRTVHKAWLDTPEGSAALDDVCMRYRKPVVLYLESVARRLRLEASIAEEVAHDWFVFMLESRAMFEPGKITGSFGAWVRRSALHRLYDRLDRERAQKRGGGATIDSIDNPRLQHDDALAEDDMFDTICAKHHLDLAEAMVQELWRERGKAHVWAELSQVLGGDATIDQARERLGLKSATTLSGHYRVLRREVREAWEALDKAKPGDSELARWRELIIRKNKGAGR